MGDTGSKEAALAPQAAGDWHGRLKEYAAAQGAPPEPSAEGAPAEQPPAEQPPPEPARQLWAEHFPDWIRRMPQRPEYEALTARDCTKLIWVYTHQAREPLSQMRFCMPNPFEDQFDRPEHIIGGGTLLCLYLGSMRGALYGNRAWLTGQAPKGLTRHRYLFASIMAHSCRLGGSGLGWSVAFVGGDRGVQMLRRRLAHRQGIELQPNQDVARTPANFMAGLGCTMSTMLLLPSGRPTPFARNFVQLVAFGAALGFMYGFIKTRGREMQLRDKSDQQALQAFRAAKGEL
eukprot:TRINITY_DN21735_c0_g1_i1.p1 TRINITY_DN21735_c0_g1~~TRINITY_DN21735_c0_g1_i1.p1  ORF type:complete len:289 (+),score=89.92 TRINITY_DN21735_c0_g1_i1:74-940(+)